MHVICCLIDVYYHFRRRFLRLPIAYSYKNFPVAYASLLMADRVILCFLSPFPNGVADTWHETEKNVVFGTVCQGVMKINVE